MESAPIDTCAACGNEGGDSLKACTACHMVKYCNRDCQIAHRPQHKTECKKRAAELRDVALFKQPPRRGDCEICFLPLPTLHTGMRYQIVERLFVVGVFIQLLLRRVKIYVPFADL